MIVDDCRNDWYRRGLMDGSLDITSSGKLERCFIRARRNGNLDLALCRFCCLIKERDAFSYVSGADAHYRVGSLVIIGAPAKNLHTDHPFPERFILSAQTMVNDVAEQILTLTAGAKGKTARHLFERLFNALLSVFRERDGRRQESSFLTSL